MASKTWQTRVSWTLDELTGKMALEYGYADRTALIKSMMRLGAMLGPESPYHEMLRDMANETPAVQEKIDGELLRRWEAKHEGMFNSLRSALDAISAALGGKPIRDLVLEAGRAAIANMKRDE